MLDEPTLGLDVVAKRAFLESLMYSNAADDCTVIYCSHQMEEIERVADNLIILERGAAEAHVGARRFLRARHATGSPTFRSRARIRRPCRACCEVQRLDGLHHYLVLDQDEDFAEFLRASGARSVQSMPVSLDRAVNGFLAKNHAAPAHAHA